LLADRCPDGPVCNAAGQGAPRCPRVTSLFAEIGLASGQMAGSWQGPRIGPAYRSSGLSGNPGGSVNDAHADRISNGGKHPGTCPVRPGEYGHRLRQAGGSAACAAGSRTAVVRCSWTQLDLMGHDPKPASRWPGTLRDYGRHTDRTRYSRGGKWRNNRSVTIRMGRDRLTVKPPTLAGRALPHISERVLDGLSARTDSRPKIISGGSLGAKCCQCGLSGVSVR
jgi:hypothetical protein